MYIYKLIYIYMYIYTYIDMCKSAHVTGVYTHVKKCQQEIVEETLITVKWPQLDTVELPKAYRRTVEIVLARRVF